MADERISRLRENIAKVYTGNRQVIDQLLTALLSGGHILIEDVPGIGKTTLAKALADSMTMDFGRVQFTPDTLPSDILGTTVFDAKNQSFRVIRGPVFHSFLLADEINRTSPKTQSALLEAMEERQVTIDGTAYPLPEPFMVVATQNPVEQLGTYPLPEAELDRFLMKISLGYPGKDEQTLLAKRFLSGELREPIQPVITTDELLEMISAVKAVIFSDELVDYSLSLVEKTRTEREVSCGVSPRGGLDLLRASQAWAYIQGRDYVIPEDVIEMAKLVLPHRIILNTEARIDHYSCYQVVLNVLNHVKRPQ